METAGRHCIRIALGVVLSMVLVWNPAFSQEEKTVLKTVGVLESFSGDVLLKHKGFWGETPRQGMTLYHGDKILTREGTCRVRFADGYLLDIEPSSSIRIAETYIKRGVKLIRQRDVRLFLGKIRYAGDAGDAVRTQLVAPAAVAALRGTDAAFGADGILATLNMLDGESDVAGNIARVDRVPGATAAQAGANPEYRASETADRVRKEYLKAVKSLLTSRNGSKEPLLLAAADPALILQIIARTGDDGAVANAHKVLLLAALYAVADMNALIEENKALLNNPDDRTADRARETLAEAMEKKEAVVRTLNQAKETIRRINAVIEDALSDNPENAAAALEDLKPIIARMLLEQKQANRVALGKELIVDIRTAGVDEALSQYEERENERLAGEAAENRADDFQVGMAIDGSAAALIDEVGPPAGDAPEGTDLDAVIRELEDEVGALVTTLTEEVDRFPDLFELVIPETETATDRDGDGVPDNRDLDPSDPGVAVDKGGYAN